MTALSAFPLPFHASRSISFTPPRTLLELQMLQCSAHIRSKPGWFEKMTVSRSSSSSPPSTSPPTSPNTPADPGMSREC
ncbi:DUF4246 domain-containing protein [Streptomyces tibetensis]|uniref:DUF4246 domain-containing protein n=1 Tax=Streptomyces tibetensis TaxID=2382123 RepID=UPI00340EBBE7